MANSKYGVITVKYGKFTSMILFTEETREQAFAEAERLKGEKKAKIVKILESK